MHKTLTAIFLLLLVNCCFAQTIPFQVSPQLTVYLPGRPDTFSRDRVAVYTFDADSIGYQAGADHLKLTIHSEHDFKSSLRGFDQGLAHKLSGYAVQQVDTTLGGTRGVFLFGVAKDPAKKGAQLFMFYTVVEGYGHFVQCVTWSEKPATVSMKKYFQSVRFTGENFPKGDFTYAISYRLGQVLGFVLVFGALFLLVRWIIRVVRR